MLIAILVLLVILTASAHIWAEYRGPRRNVYIFKPMGSITYFSQIVRNKTDIGSPSFQPYSV